MSTTLTKEAASREFLTTDDTTSTNTSHTSNKTRHLLDIQSLSIQDIDAIMDYAIAYKRALGRDTGLARLVSEGGSLAQDSRTSNIDELNSTSLKETKTRKEDRLLDPFLGDVTPFLRPIKVIGLFFENSTRTRSSFELATVNLGGDFINLDVIKSSTTKGESLRDTILTLASMRPNAFVIRHSSSGAAAHIASISQSYNVSVINAGDGFHAHPTQALLDLMTLKEAFGNLRGIRIAIVGDIKSSRVARSNIMMFKKIGVRTTLISPPSMMPSIDANALGLEDMRSTLEVQNYDAIMALRVQDERHNHPIYASLYDYANNFCVNKADARVIMHPGPVRREIDLSSDLIDGASSRILDQVENGVYTRMGILRHIVGIDRGADLG